MWLPHSSITTPKVLSLFSQPPYATIPIIIYISVVWKKLKLRFVYIHLLCGSPDKLTLNTRKMAKEGILILIFAFTVALGIQTCCGKNISRGSFPKGFVFGTASSAYQVLISLQIFQNKIYLEWQFLWLKGTRIWYIVLIINKINKRFELNNE